MAIGGVLTFLGLTAVTHCLVGSDTTVFAMCMGAGLAATVAQALWIKDAERIERMPFYLPVWWASVAATVYSISRDASRDAASS